MADSIEPQNGRGENEKPNGREKHETEEQLIRRAQNAVSRCNWEVGRCAAQWTQRYARGRTDADFANMVGLSRDQVAQRRRVAEAFGDVADDYPSLKWSHFYTVLTWDDALDCLQWAEDNEATVAEMKSWRRAQRGDDATTDSPTDGFAGDPAVLSISAEPAVVRDPQDQQQRETATENRPSSGAGENGDAGTSADSHRPLAGVPRQSNGDDYAPFRTGAGGPAPQAEEETVGTATADERPPEPPERVVKRATKSLQRLNAALTPDVLDEFTALPRDVREPFTAAVAELSTKVAGLL